MDMLKRLFGGDETERRPVPGMPRRRELSPDEQAVERYRYLLRTAPPETIEEAHAEAFAKLSPEQRRMVLQELDTTLTPAERAADVGYDDEPRALARMATRAEMRQPGTLERTWSGMPAMGGVGMGGLFLNNFMGTIAGVMVGSMIADAFLADSGYRLRVRRIIPLDVQIALRAGCSDVRNDAQEIVGFMPDCELDVSGEVMAATAQALRDDPDVRSDLRYQYSHVYTPRTNISGDVVFLERALAALVGGDGQPDPGR